MTIDPTELPKIRYLQNALSLCVVLAFTVPRKQKKTRIFSNSNEKKNIQIKDNIPLIKINPLI